MNAEAEVNHGALKAKQSKKATRDEWGTDPQIREGIVERYGRIVLDCAASATNALAERFFTKDDDALKKTWQHEAWAWSKEEGGILFCNPPYSRPNKPMFSNKAKAEASRGPRPVVLVLPADFGTRWFHCCFLHGFNVIHSENVVTGPLSGWRHKLDGNTIDAEMTLLDYRPKYESALDNPDGNGSPGGTAVIALFPKFRRPD